MGTATYRLVERAARGFHFALVTVTAEFAEMTTIVVSDQAFYWLRAAYGPDAWIDGPGLETFREEARSGAALALQQVAGYDHAVTASVVIDEIQHTNVDTSEGDIGRATGRAVWQALGVQGAR